MNDWLHEITTAVAEACGLDPADLAVLGDDARTLLDVARVVAHTSGDRTNAPLTCYVLGLAVGRGAALAAAAQAAKEAAAPS